MINTFMHPLSGFDELDQTQKDAQRYRWLRSQHWNDNTIAAVRFPKDAMKLGHDAPSGERLDELIDLAMNPVGTDDHL